MALEHLLDQIQERHRCDLRKVLGDYHMRDLPDEQVRTRIDELLRLVERMGEINLTAIEEYDEQSKRFEYLNGQKLDLEQALTQLEAAIKQMNRESKKLFREAFDAINERFQQVFPKLFGGGKASLQLTNPEDMLETGIEILAQPPGKKLGSIELMSGGEKALTAVSLIFSIFQYRPSPFCLLLRGRPRHDEALAVHRHHAQQEDHADGRRSLRRDHGDARHLEDGLGRAPLGAAAAPRGARDCRRLIDRAAETFRVALPLAGARGSG